MCLLITVCIIIATVEFKKYIDFPTFWELILLDVTSEYSGIVNCRIRGLILVYIFLFGVCVFVLCVLCLLYTSMVFGEDRLRERGSLPATSF